MKDNDNIERLIEEIKARDAERVLIQVPNGLITKSQEILDRLYDDGIQAFMSLEPMFGACDLRDTEAERLGCDLLVNVGHADFGVDEKLDTLYFHWKAETEQILPVLENGYERIEDHESIGLVSSINFIHVLEDVKAWLEERGHEALIGEGSLEPGQILGCNVSSALAIANSVDAFLFVGSGHFHPLGTGLRSEKPLYVLDVESGSIEEPDYERFERQRYAALAKAKGADSFAILVSSKPGQHFVDPFSFKERLDRLGKESWIFTMDMITQDKLYGIDADVYVNTACPRIAIEDRGSFKKPLLNPDEFARLLRDMENEESDN